MTFNYSFVGFLFYAVVTAIFVYERIVEYAIGLPFDKSYGGRYKFLTLINEDVQLAFFALSAINALFGGFICKTLFSCKKTEGADGKKECCGWYSGLLNTFFTSIVFPIGVYVSIAFWGLYFFDRELVYPKSLDATIPVWVNHVMHTLPIVIVLLEQFFVQHKYPSFFTGVSLTVLFVLAYGSWVLYMGYDSGKWVYPVLKVLSPLTRALFIASQAVAAILFYKFGSFLNASFWPAAKETTPTKSKSKKTN